MISILLGAYVSAAVLPRDTGSDSSVSAIKEERRCPPSLKNFVFNFGFDVAQYDKIDAGDHWITFGLDIPGLPSQKAKDAHIPMMAFSKHVEDAVKLVNSPDAPEWLLTFNEPDWSYENRTEIMTAQEAADAIKPLLANPGTKTKFVAPVTALKPEWLPEFFDACKCRDFFSAYNIHIYKPTMDEVKIELDNNRKQFDDKPLWITEIAPGNAKPACSLDWFQTADFMKDLYSFSNSASYIDRVFWNTGNRIHDSDTNVCNSYLLDYDNIESPLLESFRTIGC